jgi:hypothetical protein
VNRGSSAWRGIWGGGEGKLFDFGNKELIDGDVEKKNPTIQETLCWLANLNNNVCGMLSSPAI